jgi:glycosyltransferase involved in cell wall biosynthesis
MEALLTMITWPPLKVAFVSSYRPTQCGIATFTSHLVHNVQLAASGAGQPVVIAMDSDGDVDYAKPVEIKIRRDVRYDYVAAADYLNHSDVDVVSLQHEFGLFGGMAGAGEYLEHFLAHLKIPLVTTFHTVLQDPSSDQYRMTRAIADCSVNLVVMSDRGADMLEKVYGVPSPKIHLIPHGTPDLPLMASSRGKRAAGLEDRTTILTFGLLSPNKGVEVMIRAMDRIAAQMPEAIYIVLGVTHPNLLKTEGESYRRSLEDMVRTMGLEEHVVFHNQFVDDRNLYAYLQMADFYVTPYLSEQQNVSGTLAFALGTGRVIISTPYWHAQELLADGHGRLVPFDDPASLAQTILALKEDPEEYLRIRSRAYAKGRNMTWAVVGEAYWSLLSEVAANGPLRSDEAVSGALAM